MILVYVIVGLFLYETDWIPPEICTRTQNVSACIDKLGSTLPRSANTDAKKNSLLAAAEFLLWEVVKDTYLDESIRSDARQLMQELLWRVYSPDWTARDYLMTLHEAAPDDWVRLAYGELMTHFHMKDFNAHLAAAATLTDLTSETAIADRERYHYLKAVELADPGYRTGVAMWYYNALKRTGRDSEAADFRASFREKYNTGAETVADQLKALSVMGSGERNSELRKLMLQYCTLGHLILVQEDTACRSILQYVRAMENLPAELARFGGSVLPLLEMQGFARPEDKELQRYFGQIQE